MELGLGSRVRDVHAGQRALHREQRCQSWDFLSNKPETQAMPGMFISGPMLPSSGQRTEAASSMGSAP